VFGFEEIVANERLRALGVVGRHILLLFKKGASAHLPVAAHDGYGQSHLAFAIPTESLTTWEAWLGQHGIPIEEKKKWDRGGWSLYFRDPDGHLLEVATPGVWPRVY
jgi:catechol 2,3-dioxygenase-like lactoylglutathione lyase family enzyme